MVPHRLSDKINSGGSSDQTIARDLVFAPNRNRTRFMSSKAIRCSRNQPTWMQSASREMTLWSQMVLATDALEKRTLFGFRDATICPTRSTAFRIIASRAQPQSRTSSSLRRETASWTSPKRFTIV
jgi:hypothetical protein